MIAIADLTVKDSYDDSFQLVVFEAGERKFLSIENIKISLPEDTELIFSGPEGVEAIDKMIEFLTSAREEIK